MMTMFGILPSHTQYVEQIDSSIPVRGENISPLTAKKLYGQELRLSASSIDRYYACPFQYFMSAGLKLRPRIRSEFDASRKGIFLHDVIENLSKEISETTGFKEADEQDILKLTEKYIEKYAKEELHAFEGKNQRFSYLFHRQGEEAERIVLDMLQELKNSDFKPLEFESEFSETYPDDKKQSALKISGFVDRIDGWQRGEELFVRVVDYKTGTKKFNLSDVLYGRNMQMLIYLFTLINSGKERYGMKVTPAGVLYVPARDAIVKLPRNAEDGELEKKRASELRRVGLILDDPAVLEAMESGEKKKYLPVKINKEGQYKGDSLMSAKHAKILSKHVSDVLTSASQGILSGDIKCAPYYKGPQENACQFCDYQSICAFDEDLGDRRKIAYTTKTEEVWKELEAKHHEN
jgi:ATP-dependent helicase/nuclease subunit B